MKTSILTTLCFLMILGTNISAQDKAPAEKYGNTLNAGIGVGYYGYYGSNAPILHLNYEFDVAKNFTLAPFITYYSYRNYYYWGDNNNYPFRNYYYRETIIPVGVKGTYYFDQLLNANPKWDFYLAGSLGFSIVNSSWDADYYGDRNVYRGSSALYLDIHIGAEYHMNDRLGIFFDLSTGVSTVGLAIH